MSNCVVTDVYCWNILELSPFDILRPFLSSNNMYCAVAMADLGAEYFLKSTLVYIYIVQFWTFFLVKYGVRVMVFNATFNPISLISCRSVLLVEETRVPEENHFS